MVAITLFEEDFRVALCIRRAVVPRDFSLKGFRTMKRWKDVIWTQRLPHWKIWFSLSLSLKTNELFLKHKEPHVLMMPLHMSHESCLQSSYWQSHPGRGTELTEHCDPTGWSMPPLLLCSTELPHSKLTQKGGSTPCRKHALSGMRGPLQTALCSLVITLRYQDCWNIYSNTCWGSFFLPVPVKHWSEQSSLW